MMCVARACFRRAIDRSNALSPRLVFLVGLPRHSRMFLQMDAAGARRQRWEGKARGQGVMVVEKRAHPPLPSRVAGRVFRNVPNAVGTRAAGLAAMRG